VLDLAVRAADPAACLTLDVVHRFVRAGEAGRTVPDTEYAELTLAMRRGDHPRAVFDALHARGQIRLHADAAARLEALTALATASAPGAVAVVVDTREQAGAFNTAIRDRLVADGRVDDGRPVATRAGQRIGVGDRIATRRNDRTLGVANRDSWTVTAVGPRGELTVIPARHDARTRPLSRPPAPRSGCCRRTTSRAMSSWRTPPPRTACRARPSPWPTWSSASTPAPRPPTSA
jgi:exodeoxyribonuclease V alpha subunit